MRELAQEIVRNGTEPKQESFWWTRTWNGGLMVRGVGRLWILPSVKKFDLLGDRYKRSGKCEAGTKLALKKGMGSWFKEAQLDRSKAISPKRPRETMVSHGYHVTSNGWSWSLEKMKKAQVWETVMMRHIFPRLRLPDRSERGGLETMHESVESVSLSADLPFHFVLKSVSRFLHCNFHVTIIQCPVSQFFIQRPKEQFTSSDLGLHRRALVQLKCNLADRNHTPLSTTFITTPQALRLSLHSHPIPPDWLDVLSFPLLFATQLSVLPSAPRRVH